MGSKNRRKAARKRERASSGATKEATQNPSVSNVSDKPQRVEVKEQYEAEEEGDVPVEDECCDQAVENASEPANDPLLDDEIQGGAHGEVVSLEEAKKIVERLCVAMLAANIPFFSRLLQAQGSIQRLGSLIEVLEALDDDITISTREIDALRCMCAPISTKFALELLLEIAGATTFHVEMLEYQIRTALVESAFNKTRGRFDSQRTVNKLLAHLPSDELTLSSTQFAVMLEETLAIKSSILLTRIVFSRILRRHFDRKVAAAVEKSTFVSALEVFVTDKPLSTDSVEGQLRSLAARHSNLRTSFHALDADRSGSISTDEFVDFLEHEAQMRFPRGVLQAFVKRFDIDGDGTLNYDEFAAFVYPKQFGINVLTPFGLFYQPAERDETMESIVGKIKTRMFWMQHNDLFSISTAASANSSAKTTTTKLKVTDRFLITRHFGTLRVEYSPMDLVSTTFHSGELIVLILQDDIVAVVQEKERNKTVPVQDQPIPEFEYRLKLTTKRSIPPLLSMTLLRETTVEHKITSSPEEVGVQSGRPHSQSRRKHTLQSTRQRTPSIASTKSSRAEDRMPKANKSKHATLSGVFANAQPVLLKQSASSKEVQPSNQLNAVKVHTTNMSPVSSKPDEASPRTDDGAGTMSEHEYFDDAASSDENEDRDDQEKIKFFGGSDVGDESECPPDTDATVEWDEPPPPYE